jgi:hypothetical protein
MSSTMSLSTATPFVRQMSERLGVQQAGVSITLMSKGGLVDSTEVFMVRDASEKPRAVVVLSPQAAPEMVDRATARARDVAGVVGPVLARRILLPTLSGKLEGRTYAVMPYCERLSSLRPVWWMQRAKVRSVLSDWLHQVTESSLRAVSDSQVASLYEKPLALLASTAGCSDGLRRAAERASHRLSSGELRPMQVAMHGDVWSGNILVRGRSKDQPRFEDRLTLIDWAGARTDGYPLYDLVRAAGSLRMKPGALRVELQRHCDLMQCGLEHSTDYLVTALGGVLTTIENFPMENFLRMAEQCLSDVNGAVDGRRG